MLEETREEQMKNLKRNLTLGVLFFLPVMFLLFLYPSTHNYTPLEIVKSSVSDIEKFDAFEDETILLKERITVLVFLGSQPMDYTIAALNLKELVYDKFKGFKNFQVVSISQNGTQNQIDNLKDEISSYEELKHWHFVYGTESDILQFHKSLRSKKQLDSNLSSPLVYIIDKDLNQRGRIDDREKKEIANNIPEYSLVDYNCLEVSEIKNKMSEDLRILFTEYRQKRKGNFDSSIRRAEDLNTNNE